MSLTNHQNIYRDSHHLDWKDRMRKKCQLELKERRSKHLNALRDISKEESRNLLNQIINTEIETLHGDSDEIEICMKIRDEIVSELEAEFLEKVENESIMHLLAQLDRCDVLCPFCKKELLSMERNVISCPCGLVVNTQADGITLENVHHNLDAGLRAHAEKCELEPRFWILDQSADVHILCMGCDMCEFIHVVA